MKTKRPRFPADCPAFMLLDRAGFYLSAVRPGEIVEGTFNDQGTKIMLGFARGEHWQHGTPYFAASASGESHRVDKWQGAWHYTGRLLPLTRAAREMLAVVGVCR